MDNTKYKIRRLFAYIIDWYLYSLVLIIVNLICSKLFNAESTYVGTLELYSNFQASVVLLLMIIIHFGIFVVMVKKSKGRTIGKMITKLHIVSSNNAEVGYIQLIERELVILFIEGYLSPLGSYIRTFLGMMIGDVNLLTKAYFIITAASIFTSAGKLMLHDRIAKTKVVNL